MKFLPFAYCLTTITILMVGGSRLFAAENTGFKLGNATLTSSFDIVQVSYFGACPGLAYEGTATSNDIRFISYSTPPNTDLKVRLTNPKTGKSEIKTYTNPKGSNKLGLRSFGKYPGSYEVNYEIFAKNNTSVIESGKFSYVVEQYQTSRERNRELRTVSYCVSDPKIPVSNCNNTVIRQEYQCP